MRKTKAEQQMYQICYAILALCLFVGTATYYDFDLNTGITSFATIQIGDSAETTSQEKTIEITRELAMENINLAEQDIAEMQQQGFPIIYAEDLLSDANSALDRADYAELLKTGNFTNPLVKDAKQALEGLDYAGFSYAGVLVHTQQVSERKNQAYIISDSISIIELKVNEYQKLGVDVDESKTLFNSLKTAFKEERYSDAEELIEQTNSKLDAERAELTSVKALAQASKSFVERNWWQITLTAILMLIFGQTIYTKYHILKTKNKIKYLKVERKTLQNLMEKAQRDRFETGSISASEYKIKMNKYKDKIMEIKRNLPVLTSIIHKKIVKKAKHKRPLKTKRKVRK
jgi:hypothetical protein